MVATQFLRSEIMPNVFFSNTPETYIKAEDILIKFLFLQSDLPASSFGNTRTMLEIFSKLKLKDTRAITLNRFHTLFWCFHCWLWTSKCRLGSSQKVSSRNFEVQWIFFLSNILTLTFSSPSISESCIEIKINLNFYFHGSLWCFKRFYKDLNGLHETFWGTIKKCENKKLS